MAFKLNRSFAINYWRKLFKTPIITYKTPLETVDLSIEANNIRKIIVANALSIVGISASNKETYKMFETLLGPTYSYWDLKRPFRVWKENGKWRTQGVSTCGLVARGIWRRSGVDMPQIYKNYNFGMAMIEEQIFCRSVSAWHKASKDDKITPLPGDYIIIGSGLSTHNLTCVGWNGNKMISVDGGRVGSKGLQCIEKVERDFVTINGYAYLKDNRSTRKIVGWGVVDLLPYRKTAVAPEGWESIFI